MMLAVQALTISSPSGSTEADFVPGANMVCCSVRHHGAELLHQGEGVRAYAERGKTMGIPLLHPWANRLASRTYRAAGKEVTLRSHDRRITLDPAGLPIHGIIPGLLRWEPQQPGTTHALIAHLAWDAPELLELFPYRPE